MSEKLKHTESAPSHSEHAPSGEHHRPSTERLNESKKETLSVEKSRETISEIHKHNPGTAHAISDNDSQDSRASMPMTDSLTQKLRDIRHVLRPSEKRFSKIIHNHTVSTVSEATAKTVARPYAVLAGGFFACVGSAIYMYYTRHLGYKYNFFVPILLFGAGLAVGIVVEVLFRAVNRGKKRSG
jgi:hypothetical protein